MNVFEQIGQPEEPTILSVLVTVDRLAEQRHFFDALIGENLHLMQDVSRRTALLGTARHRDDAVRAELVAADDDPHEGLMRRRSHRRFAQRVVALKAVADRRAARFFPVETHGERPFAP